MDIIISALEESFITAVEFDTYVAQIEALEKSNAKAEESFEQIKDFAISTPYKISEAVGAFVKLKVAGVEEPLRLLRTIGDTSSAIGSDLNTTIATMINASHGKLEELKKLGIDASIKGENAIFNFTASNGENKEIIIKNNEELIQNTLSTIWNDKYQGAMDLRNNTFSAAWSNTKESLSSLGAELVEPIVDVANHITTKVPPLFDTASDSVRLFYSEFKDIDELNQIDELNLRIQDLHEKKISLEEKIKSSNPTNKRKQAQKKRDEKSLESTNKEINQIVAKYEEIYKDSPTNQIITKIKAISEEKNTKKPEQYQISFIKEQREPIVIDTMIDPKIDTKKTEQLRRFIKEDLEKVSTINITPKIESISLNDLPKGIDKTFSLEVANTSNEYLSQTNEDTNSTSTICENPCKDESKERYAELGNTMGDAFTNIFMKTLNGGSFKNAVSSSFLDTSNQMASQMISSSVNDLASQGATSLAQASGMSPGAASATVALTMGVAGALLEEPSEVLIESKDFLADLTATNAKIAEQTESLKYLNNLFDTSYSLGNSGNFLDKEGGHYTFGTSTTGDIFDYFADIIYGSVEDRKKIYKIKTGEETIQKSKSGFMGIGAKTWTETRNIYKDFYGNEVAALEFLSQFGVDAEGVLTDSGLDNLKSSFNTMSEFSDQLEEIGKSQAEIIQKKLDNIDLTNLRNDISLKYSQAFSNIGVDLGNLTYESLDDIFNDDNISKLIQEDSSINLESLTSSFKSLNEAFETQIDLSTQLNKLKLEEIETQYNYQLSLKDLEDEISNTIHNIGSDFIDVFDNLGNMTESLRDSTNSTISTIKEDGNTNEQQLIEDIKDYNKLKETFNTYFDERGILLGGLDTEDINDTYMKLLSTATDITSNESLQGTSYTNTSSELLSDLENYKSMLDDTDTAIKVEIVSGLGDLVGLSEDQKTQLQSLVSSGSLTSSTLSTISSLSTEQKTELQSLATSGNLSSTSLGTISTLSTEQKTELQSLVTKGALTNTTLSSLSGLSTTQVSKLTNLLTQTNLVSTEDTLSDLTEHARLQLEEFRNAQAIDTANLSVDSFEYLHEFGTQEQLDIATFLGTEYSNLSTLISSLQSLEIKDTAQDLNIIKSLINFSGTNASDWSVDSTKFGYLQTLAEEGVLPEDAITALNSLKNTIKVWDVSSTQIRHDVAEKSHEEVTQHSGWTPFLVGIKAQAEREGHRTSDITTKHTEIYDHENNWSATWISYLDVFKKVVDQAAYTYYTTQKGSRLDTSMFNSFDIGTSYVPHDQIANIHKGEIIIDPQSSQILRDYGISTPTINVDFTGIEKKMDDLIDIQTQQGNQIRKLRQAYDFQNKVNNYEF